MLHYMGSYSICRPNFPRYHAPAWECISWLLLSSDYRLMVVFEFPVGVSLIASGAVRFAYGALRCFLVPTLLRGNAYPGFCCLRTEEK